MVTVDGSDGRCSEGGTQEEVKSCDSDKVKANAGKVNV